MPGGTGHAKVGGCALQVTRSEVAPRLSSAAGEARAVRSFWLLAAVNAFVGSMVGLERTIVPILAEQDFGLRVGASIGSFIIAFAIAKAVFNLLDRKSVV